MVQVPGLLTLPPEIRDQIWMLAFGGLQITPFTAAYDLPSSCVACVSLAEKQTEIIPHAMAIAPLLTCKQIYNEAKFIIYQTLSVHISSSAEMSKIGMTGNHSPILHGHIRKLTLYVHLDSESRTHWVPELSALPITFPGLQQLRIHCHMRPPRDFDSLIDATFLLGPLVLLPSGIRPSAERARLDLSESETSGNESSKPTTIQQERHHHYETSRSNNEDDTSTPSPPHASRDLNPNFQIHFDYNVSEVLFDSPFIGTISTADALDEHDAVLRDCLANSEFRQLAEQRDQQSMIMVLFSIAREHEHGWLEGLYRRRIREYSIETEVLGELDDLANSSDIVESSDGHDDDFSDGALPHT